MRRYLIRITMRDGSTGRHHGIYPNGFAAIVYALEAFPNALRISSRRIV
jgi:hypothetical protein